MPRKPKAPKPPDLDVETFSLYSGEVEISFKKSSHRYKVSDLGSKPEQCPSVTTVLNVLAKPALIPWAVGKTADFMYDGFKELIERQSFSVESVFHLIERSRRASDDFKQEAADIGTSTHDYLAAYWRGFMTGTSGPPLPEEGKVRTCIEAALDWFQEHDMRPVLIETPVYSRLYKITGQPDFIGYIDGKFAVLDYKSTKSLYAELPLQCCAYAKLYEEEFGQAIGPRWGLRLDKENGSFEAREYPAETMPEDWDTYLAAFKLYDRLKFLRRVPKPSENWLEELE